MTQNLQKLVALRQEIDKIDAQMHALLMKRGEIVNELVAAKNTAASGSAFRPLREAQMMQAFKERHHGDLPLSLVIHLWRTIISTFTHQQAPYSVHVLASEREAARRHFGFGVPFIEHRLEADIIKAVQAAKGDLGFLSINGKTDWASLGGDNPLIMATAPVLEPMEAVIIAPSNTDTAGLETMFVVENNKLLALPRSQNTDLKIIGYA